MRCCWKIMTNLLLLNLKSHRFLRNDHKDNKIIVTFWMFRLWSLTQHKFYLFLLLQLIYLFSFVILENCFFFLLFSYICLMFIWCLPFWHISSDCVYTFSMHWMLLMDDDEIMNYICSFVLNRKLDPRSIGIFIYFFRTTSVCVVHLWAHVFLAQLLKWKSVTREKKKRTNNEKCIFQHKNSWQNGNKVHESKTPQSHLIK